MSGIVPYMDPIGMKFTSWQPNHGPSCEIMRWWCWEPRILESKGKPRKSSRCFMDLFVRCFFFLSDCTLPETNSSPLRMDGWNTFVSFWGPAYFQGRTVKLRGCMFVLFPGIKQANPYFLGPQDAWASWGTLGGGGVTKGLWMKFAEMNEDNIIPYWGVHGSW